MFCAKHGIYYAEYVINIDTVDLHIQPSWVDSKIWKYASHMFYQCKERNIISLMRQEKKHISIKFCREMYCDDWFDDA